MPIKFKFMLTDLVLFYKIINSLVPINLPENFTFVIADDVKFTRNTSAIINSMDKTRIACSINPSCNSFKNCFFYRTMKIWNTIPYLIRQEPKISIFKERLIKLLWSAEIVWPD